MDEGGEINVLDKLIERLTQKEVRKHRKRIREFKHKKDKIEYLMLHFKEARTDDNALCYLYWKIAEDARKMDDFIFLTGAGSILRTRQQIRKEKKGS